MKAVRDRKVIKPGEIGVENGPGGLYYLIHWKDEPDLEDTWETATQIRHLKEVVRAFHSANPEKPRSIWGAPTKKRKRSSKGVEKGLK